VREERRRYPRADVEISIRTGTGAKDGDEIRTVNLSGAGVAFDSERWIEPYTKLEVIFVFPPLMGTDPGVERMVRADAVVMRTDPDEPDAEASSYRIACAFTAIQSADQDFVADYVDKVLQGAKAKT
jgi:hypothetical protein